MLCQEMLKSSQYFPQDCWLERVLWSREMGIGGLIRGAPGPVIGIVGYVSPPHLSAS